MEDVTFKPQREARRSKSFFQTEILEEIAKQIMVLWMERGGPYLFSFSAQGKSQMLSLSYWYVDSIPQAWGREKRDGINKKLYCWNAKSSLVVSYPVSVWTDGKCSVSTCSKIKPSLEKVSLYEVSPCAEQSPCLLEVHLLGSLPSLIAYGI